MQWLIYQDPWVLEGGVSSGHRSSSGPPESPAGTDMGLWGVLPWTDPYAPGPVLSILHWNQMFLGLCQS